MKKIFLMIPLIFVTGCTSVMRDRLKPVDGFDKLVTAQSSALGECVLKKVREKKIPDLFGPKAIYKDAVGQDTSEYYLLKPNVTAYRHAGGGAASFYKTDTWLLYFKPIDINKTKVTLTSNYNRLHKKYDAPIDAINAFISDCLPH